MGFEELKGNPLYREMYAERGEKIREALERKRANGEVAGSLSVGMKAALVDGKKVLVEDPETQTLLRAARALSGMGRPVREVRTFLALCGITKKSGEPLSVSTVHSLLQREP